MNQSASHLHELTYGEQVSQSDVITTKERLSPEEHGLQFVQSVIELRQCTSQPIIIHLGASLSWEEHLGQVGGDGKRETGGGRDQFFFISSI